MHPQSAHITDVSFVLQGLLSRFIDKTSYCLVQLMSKLYSCVSNTLLAGSNLASERDVIRTEPMGRKRALETRLPDR